MSYEVEGPDPAGEKGSGTKERQAAKFCFVGHPDNMEKNQSSTVVVPSKSDGNDECDVNHLSVSPDAVVDDALLLLGQQQQQQQQASKHSTRLIHSLLFLFDDDILSTILSFLNYSAAENLCQILLSNCSNKKKFARLSVWREIFQRRGFSVQDVVSTTTDDDYHKELRYRRKLLHSVLKNVGQCRHTDIAHYGSSSSAATRSVAQRRHFFSFLPRDWLLRNSGSSVDYQRRNRGIDDDKPAVLQFQLLSTGVSPELLVYDRDNQGRTTVAVHANNVFAKAISPNSQNNLHRAAMEMMSEASSCGADNERTCHQILFRTDDRETDLRLLTAKPILQDDGIATESTVVGMMLQQRREETEFRFLLRQRAANKKNQQDQFDYTWGFKLRDESQKYDSSIMMDFATTLRDKPLVFVAAARRRSAQTDTTAQTTIIQAYRSMMMPSEDDNGMMLCSRPDFVMDCHDDIVTFCASPPGNEVFVVTAKGNLQVWSVCATDATLTEEISIPDALYTIFRGLSVQRPESFLGSLIGNNLSSSSGARTEARICMPRHLPPQACGFVTVHTAKRTVHSPGVHTVLFWEKKQTSTVPFDLNEQQCSWKIYAMINLPLLPDSTPPPQLYYDGNRLVVFGRDHIGPIILVYKVLSTLESVVDEEPVGQQPFSLGQASSAGVYNFSATPVPRVDFACRIRNEALGGIEQTAYLPMKCNERFIVVHTKRGDRLQEGVARVTPSGSHNDGLFIIDLDESNGREKGRTIGDSTTS